MDVIKLLSPLSKLSRPTAPPGGDTVDTFVYPLNPAMEIQNKMKLRHHHVTISIRLSEGLYGQYPPVRSIVEAEQTAHPAPDRGKDT